MQIPHPKFLIPALFSVVAGVPMLLQASLPVVNVSATISGNARTEVQDARTVRQKRIDFNDARDMCIKMRRETDRDIACPTGVDDPVVQRFLTGKTAEDLKAEAEKEAAHAQAIEIDPSALTTAEQHVLLRAKRLGSCDMWTGFSEAFNVLCRRTIDEMEPGRQARVTKRIQEVAPERLHTSAPAQGPTSDQRIKASMNARPDANTVKRFRFRRDGTLDLGNAR